MKYSIASLKQKLFICHPEAKLVIGVEQYNPIAWSTKGDMTTGSSRAGSTIGPAGSTGPM